MCYDYTLCTNYLRNVREGESFSVVVTGRDVRMKELKMLEQKLKSIYNPGHYAGFGGVRNLVRAVREEGFASGLKTG